MADNKVIDKGTGHSASSEEKIEVRRGQIIVDETWAPTSETYVHSGLTEMEGESQGLEDIFDGDHTELFAGIANFRVQHAIAGIAMSATHQEVLSFIEEKLDELPEPSRDTEKAYLVIAHDGTADAHYPDGTTHHYESSAA